ncbi:hypothetical protein BFINE_06170 [Bacteroides finegoldii DSM 17565]|nr:hypothetical protein BFINE_06170 [Bacteroides finegoldii DSM 17565]
MDEQEALEKVKALLARPGEPDVSPLAVYRHNSQDSVSRRRPNVVLIMMESMSSNFMKRFGQSQNLTPFLDSLYACSLVSPTFIRRGFIPIMVCTLLYILFLL